MARLPVESLCLDSTTELTEAKGAASSAFLDEVSDLRAQARERPAERDKADAKPAEQKPRTSSEIIDEAVAKFEKATDKKKAIDELRSDFNAGIKRADEELEAVKQKVLVGLQALAPDMAKALARVNPAVQNLFKTVEDNVPEASRRDIQRKVARYVHMDPSNAEHAKLKADLTPYRGVVAAADNAAKELKAARPIMSKYDPPAIELERAVNNSYFARQKFADRLKETGYTNQARDLSKDAQKVMSDNPDPSSEALRMQQQLEDSLKAFDVFKPKR